MHGMHLGEDKRFRRITQTPGAAAATIFQPVPLLLMLHASIDPTQSLVAKDRRALINRPGRETSPRSSIRDAASAMLVEPVMHRAQCGFWSLLTDLTGPAGSLLLTTVLNRSTAATRVSRARVEGAMSWDAIQGSYGPGMDPGIGLVWITTLFTPLDGPKTDWTGQGG